MSEKTEMQNRTGMSFRELREAGRIYVDKTMFAESLLAWGPPAASIILHPCGFGKSLNMSMLHDFCDIRQDSRAIFEGLAISENKEVCDKRMNQYPVVLLSLKDVRGGKHEEAMDRFIDVMKSLCTEFDFLRQSPAIAAGRQYEDPLSRIEKRLDERRCLSHSLLALSRALYDYYGKRAIVLIDDFDVPLLHAQEQGYYDEMADFLGSLYGSVMKDNKYLEFGVLTGCLPYTNHSDISGFNNFSTHYPSDICYAGQFGLTPEEAGKLLAETGFSAKKAGIEDWCKGYVTGDDTEVFCTRDIMSCIAALQENPEAEPDQYRGTPEEQEFIQKIVDGMAAHELRMATDLLTGACLQCAVKEKQFFTMGEHDEERLWYLLYLAGFLTQATEEQKAQSGQELRCCSYGYSPYGSIPLVIPNKRVRTLFTEAVNRRFREKAARNKAEFLRMFWAGDADGLEELLYGFLGETVICGADESGYCDFLTGLFDGTGCEAGSDGGPGHGRQEIVIPDPENDRCAVVGIAYAGGNELSDAAGKALDRARERAEAEGLKDRYKNTVLWGMGFCRRFCRLRAETA